jgi:ABC-type uncharacterized transport system involved in gliding motility auxiliary subunit
MANRIFSLFGWLGTLLVFLAVIPRVAMRVGVSIPPSWDRYSYYLALVGLVCMVIYILSQWREIAGVFAGRQARYGTLALVSVLIVAGILVAINYIGKRQNKRWDLTAAKQFSLSDQSRNILAKLDSPLEMLAFDRETQFQTYRDRLQGYEYASKQVKTDYIDPEKKPLAAQQNGVQQLGTIVFKYKGRTERVTSSTEQDITNGVIKIVSGQQRKVYFTSGHGEKDTASSERDGYNAISSGLGAENYGVEKVVLAQTGAVPADATVLVVAGPKNDFFPQEVDALKAYLGKSGKVLLMLDPVSKADAPDLPNLKALAHDWGIDVGNDIVVDASGMGRLIGTDASVPVAASYPSHPIVDRFNVITAYPMARSAAPVSGGVNGHTAQTFVESSPRSWAESDIKGLLASGEVALDPGKDKPGPVSLAAAVSAASTETPPAGAAADAPKPETRVVVFGDSDFPSNGVLGIQGNRDLFMNAVGWLSQQENLISIRPKEADDRRITLTATQQSNITWMSLLIVPVLIFGSGVYGWWQRR